MSGSTFDEEAQMWQTALQESEGDDATVDPDTVWAAVRGDLPPDQLAALIDRLATDADLQVAWRLAAELQRHEARAASAPSVPKPANRWWMGGIALVAAALVAVLVMSVRPDDGGETRGDAEIVTAIVDRTALPRSAFVLTWSQQTNATAIVELRTSDLTLVAQSERLTDGMWQVPEQALADVSAGDELVWRVTVRSDGVSQTSPAFVVTLSE